MHLIYIMSPYSHEDTRVMEARFRAVLHYVHQHSLSNEHFIYSPIVYFHQRATLYDAPRDAISYDQQNRFMLRMAGSAEVLMLPGWEESYGINALEIPYARSINLEVRYIEPEEETRALAESV